MSEVQVYTLLEHARDYGTKMFVLFEQHYIHTKAFTNKIS